MAVSAIPAASSAQDAYSSHPTRSESHRRVLAILAIVLFATKKVAEFVIAAFCVLLFGYGSYVMIRDFRKPGFLRGETKSRVA